MKKRTDGGYEIPEEELKDMDSEEEEITSKQGHCRFCGQVGIVNALYYWNQEEINEAVTMNCDCENAQKYSRMKERIGNAKRRIKELFEMNEVRKVEQEVIMIVLDSVEAIGNQKMKGLSIDLGNGIKVKITLTAKESIKVERVETSKKAFEE